MPLSQKPHRSSPTLSVIPNSPSPSSILMDAFRFQSHAVSRVLAGCNTVILFAATVGIALDRLLTKYSKAAPTKAILLSAFGTERVESLCDAFNRDIATEYGCTAPRFSAGYGDCSLEVQRDIVRVLDCARKIGVTLTESLLMSPAKSVTAFIGIGGEGHAMHGCAHCNKSDCIHRRNV